MYRDTAAWRTTVEEVADMSHTWKRLWIVQEASSLLPRWKLCVGVGQYPVQGISGATMWENLNDLYMENDEMDFSGKSAFSTYGNTAQNSPGHSQLLLRRGALYHPHESCQKPSVMFSRFVKDATRCTRYWVWTS